MLSTTHRSIVNSGDSLAIAMESCLDRIVSRLSAAHPWRDPVSLSHGPAGLAVLFAHLDRWKPEQGYRGLALAHLAAARQALEGRPMGGGLFTGLTGIAWAHAHVADVLGEISPLEPHFDEIEELLVRHILQAADLAVELTCGLVGMGVFGLAMARAGRGPRLLETILSELGRRASDWGLGGPWLTPAAKLPRHQLLDAPEGYFNLGLAHGIPGVTALLGQSVALGIGGLETERLLRRTLRWLQRQRNPEDSPSCFGPWVPVNETEEQRSQRHLEPHRVAWCYGDLGIGVGFLEGALGARHQTCSVEALAICRKAAARCLDQSGAVDASLCHGSAGNAHLFHRLYLSTGDHQFKDACRAYLWRTVQQELPPERGGGFRFWQPSSKGRAGAWTYEPGFLVGMAGIGLVLASGLSGLEPTWDEVLMANLPSCE